LLTKGLCHMMNKPLRIQTYFERTSIFPGGSAQLIDDVICRRVKTNVSGSKSPMALTAQLTLSNVSVSLKASGHPELFWGSWINDWRPTESQFLSTLKVRLGPNFFTTKTFDEVLSNRVTSVCTRGC
jgi:hypothetical protein